MSLLKRATAGYRNVQLLFSRYMDMVCEKIKQQYNDFEKDPIEYESLGDMLYAIQTI